MRSPCERLVSSYHYLVPPEARAAYTFQDLIECPDFVREHTKNHPRHYEPQVSAMMSDGVCGDVPACKYGKMKGQLLDCPEVPDLEGVA